VTVVVERSVYDAHETERGYELIGIGNLRERRGPVVVWDKTPTDEERKTLEGCLTGA
jgi:hypothetical protein